MTAKNIVVCCDGTANQFATDRTNVVKLFFTLEQDTKAQVSYYHPGVGTMEPPGSLTPLRRKASQLLGQALGWGLDYDIRDAYSFVMNNYEEGDKLYLFGFSRGAYTVRAMASLLHMYGLIRPGNEPLIPYAIRMMMGVDRAQRAKDTSEIAKARAEAFDLAREFRQHFCGVSCEPYFIGVWDTVSSVGWIENPLRLPYSADNPDIQIGRHVVSIDERRAFFRSNLWRPTAGGGPKDIKQVWFPGVHCDVGGGYPEAESGLANISLEWMLREARNAGLLCDDAKVALMLGQTDERYVKPDPKANMHKSLTGAWNIAELIPKRHYNWAKKQDERRMNLWRRRTTPPGAVVHRSARERGEAYAQRLPKDVVFET